VLLIAYIEDADIVEKTPPCWIQKLLTPTPRSGLTDRDAQTTLAWTLRRQRCGHRGDWPEG